MDTDQPNPQPSNVPPSPDSNQPVTNEPIIIQPTVQLTSVPTPQLGSNEAAAPIDNQQLVQNTPPDTPPEQPFMAAQPETQLPPQAVTPDQTFTPSTPNTAFVEANPPSQQYQQVPQPNYPVPVMGTMSASGALPGKPKRKKLLLAGGVVAFFLVLSTAIVFGYYLPNQPNNIYKTGVNRSAKALDKLINAATEKSKLEAFKKSDITLSVDAKYQDISYTGSFNAKFDGSKADGGINFVSKQTSQPNQTFSAKFQSELPSGSQYPNIYVQLTGLKTFGIDDYLPGFAAYDGKWIAILSDYLKSLGTVPTAEETSKKQLTSDDIAELARAASGVTVDYVFSTEPNKAVFEKKSYVGKEKVDNTNAYHYKVGLNKEHVKAYCKAMIDKIYSTDAYKKLPWVDEKNVDKDKEAASKDCDSSYNGIKADTTYELWVDAKYKLIYKIRIPDATDKETYTDVGQVYKGGDSVSLFAAYHSGKDKSDGKFTLDTNLKAGTTKGTLTFSGGDLDNKYDIKVTLDAKPYNGEINTNKPAGAIPVQEVLKQLGIDPALLFGTGDAASTAGTDTPSGGIQQKARDTERKTDINALYSQLEAYFAQNGFYPTLDNVNNSSWRAANMQGLDAQALKDPEGTATTLGKTATAVQYGYTASGCASAGECTGYTLTATLSSGTTYTKQSLN